MYIYVLNNILILIFIHIFVIILIHILILTLSTAANSDDSIHGNNNETPAYVNHRFSRFLEVPRTSLLEDFDASKTPELPSSPPSNIRKRKQKEDRYILIHTHAYSYIPIHTYTYSYIYTHTYILKHILIYKLM